MITIDENSLEQRALHEDGCYMVGIGDGNIKAVLMNGARKNHVMFVDTVLGFAIVHKQDITGKLVVFGDDLIYEVVFGKFEVVFDVVEKSPA